LKKQSILHFFSNEQHSDYKSARVLANKGNNSEKLPYYSCHCIN